MTERSESRLKSNKQSMFLVCEHSQKPPGELLSAQCILFIGCPMAMATAKPE